MGTGTTMAPPPPVPSADFFLSPTFVQTLAAALVVDAVDRNVFGRGLTAGARAVYQSDDRSHTVSESGTLTVPSAALASYSA